MEENNGAVDSNHASSSEKKDEIFIGFDFSTQQVKGVALNGSSYEVLAEERVHFDSELPEYRTQGGVNLAQAGRVVTSPTIMWVKALDILLEKLRITGIDFGQVKAISGCGQQHGSVYWRHGASTTLSNLDPDKFLHEELAQAFSILDSPVWMDSSTTSECRILEELMGGPQALADLTGSRAYERFTANQISKMNKEHNEALVNTERVSLVSSFACSLFLGRYADIDVSDAGGMNLLDISTKEWAQDCLDACAQNLHDKLGSPVGSNEVLGAVSHYMVERYGFSDQCMVTAFTGDNQASLAGLQMQPGDLGLSLGTSDTVFVWMESGEDSQVKPQLMGHIWPNPLDNRDYMALLCYKNGSLTRERICREDAESSWEIFSQLIDSTPRGNFGNIGMFYDHPEITPANVCGDFKFNKNDERVTRFASKEAEVRALIEGQMMAKRLHAEQLGYQLSRDRRILVCGGGSVNKAILQIIADVFNAPVYTKGCGSTTAAFGSALRAKFAMIRSMPGNGELSFSEVIQSEQDPAILKCTPHKDSHHIYKPLLERYKALEQKILSCKHY